MCLYDANQMACGCWKWGHFRQHCAKEYRTGQNCGMKLVINCVSKEDECRICTKIDKKEKAIAKESARIDRWTREGKGTASIAKAQDEIAKLQDDLQKLIDEKMVRILQMVNKEKKVIEERASTNTLVESDTEEFKDVMMEDLEDLV